MSATLRPRPTSEARTLWSLAALALPFCSALAVALALGLMGWVGCTYISPTVAGVAASTSVVLLGALASSLVVNIRHARRAIGLAAQVATDDHDPGRLADVAAIANMLGTAPPILRVVPLDAPVAFGVQTDTPAIVVSTWVLEHLDPDEWRAVIAHELAHLRHGDRLVRWTGCWLLGASRLIPGSRAAWRRLEQASEAAADAVAGATLGGPAALASARAKFGGAQASSPADLAWAWSPPSRSSRLAAACVGLVLSLPLVPFALVPLCAMVCAR